MFFSLSLLLLSLFKHQLARLAKRGKNVKARIDGGGDVVACRVLLLFSSFGGVFLFSCFLAGMSVSVRPVGVFPCSTPMERDSFFFFGFFLTVFMFPFPFLVY